MTQPDPTDRIAAFGRWTFFAGAVYASVLTGAWRIFGWPTWLGAVASVAGGYATYRVIDWIAARATPASSTTTGRCGHSLHAGFSGNPLICALPAGHAGWHRDDNRAEWGPITEVTKP